MKFEKAMRKKATHGHRIGRVNTGTYTSWESMKKRCSKGGQYFDKGISVCLEWLSFSSFLDDMGERPPGTTLDRIDPKGNYEKTNCRWADNTTQSRNRSDRKLIEYDGKVMLLTDWAQELNISFSCLYKRIYKLNWTIDKAFATDSRSKKNEIRESNTEKSKT